jgi:hypothetical protein
LGIRRLLNVGKFSEKLETPNPKGDDSKPERSQQTRLTVADEIVEVSHADPLSFLDDFFC